MVRRVIGVVVTVAAGARAAPPLRVGDLTTEHAERPLGIDETAPRFGWTLDARRRGERQTAYRVTVGTRPGRADAWDSGRVRSSRSFDAAYAGAPLRSRTRYWWRVQV